MDKCKAKEVGGVEVGLPGTAENKEPIPSVR